MLKTSWWLSSLRLAFFVNFQSRMSELLSLYPSSSLRHLTCQWMLTSISISFFTVRGSEGRNSRLFVAYNRKVFPRSRRLLPSVCHNQRNVVAMSLLLLLTIRAPVANPYRYIWNSQPYVGFKPSCALGSVEPALYNILPCAATFSFP